ncbi:MAG: NAD(P)-dependent oxidoreductase, partial [Armatimonadetes bacterium]|nr:NAD(P)-dependent oxidoreductase [Armatimonadota bacterium]
ERGITYLDAMLSGSSAQIRRRAATVMVGGTPEAVADNRDILAALSDKVHHIGPAGSGARAKLASNLVLGLNRLALAEGLVFAERLGLDPAAFLELLRDTPARSAAMDAKGERMVHGRFEPESRIRQHLKDVELILRFARAAGQALPLTAVHHELLAAAIEAGDGELDNAAIILEVRRRGTKGPAAG